MDRIISDEEKIKRAIEISQRRNSNYYTKETARVNVSDNKRNYRLFKKMILQIVICLLIYSIFYLISTTNYVFSEQVLKETTNILSYDINFEKIYKDFQGFFGMTFNGDEKEIEVNNANDNENFINVNSIQENMISNKEINISIVDNTVNNTKNEKNIENTEIVSNNKEENSEEITMKKDAEKVKKICKIQKPLNGTITSEFGTREVILDGMTSEHKGIDIAANSGTSIKAATSGSVSVAEENSEYGKFIKIVNGDVMTVYAHCKSLKVKKGDKVKIGQTIATVGSTGKSTGPHLHFEIRLENRYINPRYVIKF